MAVDRYCVDCRHYSDPSYCYYHDGVVDEKDRSIAGRVLASGRKKRN